MATDNLGLDAADEEFNPLDVVGVTGLKHHSGFIDEEFMHRLRGRNAIRIYREMIDNSPIVAAALNAIKMLIRQVEWRIEPANESSEALAEAEDTESALEDMSHTFQDFISEALSMIWAGYAPLASRGNHRVERLRLCTCNQSGHRQRKANCHSNSTWKTHPG